MTDKKKNNGRRGSRKPLSDLLHRDDLIRMREHGMTYTEIAGTVGYCPRLVNEYAHTLLPTELTGKQPRRKDTPPTAHYLELLVCTRCHLAWSADNPVDFVTRLCLWCRFDAAGIDLHKAYRSGLYHAILQQEHTP